MITMNMDQKEKFALKNGVHYYQQIYDDIYGKIVNKEYLPDEKIPVEKVLINQYNTSITSVRKAISLLCEKGLLVKHQGRGTFVTENKKKNPTIGLVFPPPGSSWEPFVTGLEETLKKENYRLRFYIYNWQSPSHCLENIRNCCSENSGAIIFPGYHPDMETIHFLRTLCRKRFPFVLVEKNYAPTIQTDFVGTDYFWGMKEIVNRLTDRHKRIAILIDPNHESKETLKGYYKGLKDKNIKIDKSLVKTAYFYDEGATRKSILQLLNMPNRPAAVICPWSAITLLTIQILRELKIGVPDEMELVGIGNEKILASVGIPLKILKCPRFEMGQSAGTIIIDKIKKGISQMKVLRLRPELLSVK